MMATEPTAPTDRQDDLDLWRCIACDGALRAARRRRLVACQGCGHVYPVRGRRPGRQGDGLRQQQGRRRLLQQPALAQVPLLGVVHVRLQRRREAVARQGAPPPARSRPTSSCSTWRSATASTSTGSRPTGRSSASTSRPSSSKPAGSGPAAATSSLILGEAEDLPVQDGQFDAALSIGGFNYFNDPEKALREMARAVKPGGTIVVSDEIPNLTDRMLFRKIGLPGVDRWIVSKMLKLGDDFTDMVEKYRTLDVQAHRQPGPPRLPLRADLDGRRLRPGRQGARVNVRRSTRGVCRIRRGFLLTPREKLAARPDGRHQGWGHPGRRAFRLEGKFPIFVRPGRIQPY